MRLKKGDNENNSINIENLLINFEAADKELAYRDPVRLIQFLLAVKKIAKDENKKKLFVECPIDSNIRFIVDGNDVYREIHEFEDLYVEEHLKERFPGIEVYEIKKIIKIK